MKIASTDRDLPSFASVEMTDARSRLDQIVDECQREPVILKEHRRNRAAVVSMQFLAQALEALHGHREVITSPLTTDEQMADLATSWPSAAELAADRWSDQSS